MQCFSKKLPILFQIFILLNESTSSIVVLDKGLVSLQKNSVGLQFYIDIENKDRLSGCAIDSRTENCCLTDGEEDCDTMFAYGGSYFIKPKDRDIIIFVYPTTFQHDQVGYCNFILNYQCGKNRRSKTQKVNVDFDTRIVQNADDLLGHYTAGKSKSNCDTLDQDSLHDCEPVDCDVKYAGERSYYDSFIGKCVEVPICESDQDSELPDIVYVPNINACRDLEHPLTVADIFSISTGMGVVTQNPKDDNLKVEMRSNCSTISQNLKFLRDVMFGRLCPVTQTDMSDYSKCCKSAMWAIVTYIGGICGLLLSFFCCVHTTAWLHKKFKDGEFRNFVQNFKNMFKAPKRTEYCYGADVNSEVRKTLLREVIIRDIPMELRDSLVNICDRMDRKVKKKKRYRNKDLGSQVNLSQVDYDVRMSTATSSTSSIEEEECHESQNLLK